MGETDGVDLFSHGSFAWHWLRSLFSRLSLLAQVRPVMSGAYFLFGQA
jgi:hypothetical protein